MAAVGDVTNGVGQVQRDPDCDLCSRELADGPPGGWVYQDDLWSVGISPGFEVPGWVACQVRRHTVGTTSLTEEERTALGPILARLTDAISAVTGSEKVYFVAYGETYPHWHYLMMAVPDDVDPGHKGPNLMPAKDNYVDLERSLEVAAELRSALSVSA